MIIWGIIMVGIALALIAVAMLKYRSNIFGGEDSKLQTVLIVSFILGIIALIAFILLFAPQGSGDDSDDDYFPYWLWIVILIPILTQNKQKKADPKTRKMLAVAIGLAVLGIFLALFLIAA